jgi:hypothetical protein
MVRAKFTVTEHRLYSYDAARGPELQAREVILTPQYDQAIPEDRRFAQATPSGKLAMRIDNPAALKEFTLGRAFYLDMTPVDETNAPPA